LEVAWATVVDAAGHVYVAGLTDSTDFPVLAGIDTSWNGGGYDGFLVKVDGSGTSLAWSSYLGGTGSDRIRDLTIDAAGNLYVVGQTASSNFPVPGGFDTTYGGGGSDAFVTRLDPSGTSLAWSSFLGGNSMDDAWGVAVDLGGNIYVTGVTASSDFPSAGGFDSTLDGEDVFVTKLAVPQANGVACNTNADCISALCEDGVCCAVACGLCASCDAVGSACSVMPVDDAGCGPIDCDFLDVSCRDYTDITAARCATLGVCKASDAAICTLYTDVIGSCEDGSGCTLNDTCNAGVCMSGASLACLPMNECHEAGTCDPLTGLCSEPTKPDGTSCSLGACQDGECVSSGQGGGGTGGVGGEAGASASAGSGAGGHGGNVSTGSGRGGIAESAGGAGGSVEGGSGPFGTSVGGANSATPNPPSPVASDGCDCATPASDRSRPSSSISLLGAALLLAIKRRRAAKRRAASERSRL
jgi:hypothetical protein